MSTVSGLQRKYVEEVLDVVRGQKEKILECLGESSKISIQFRLEIETNGVGKVMPLNSNDGASACLTGVLAEVRYPPHKLARKVEIEFPLELERRSF